MATIAASIPTGRHPRWSALLSLLLAGAIGAAARPPDGDLVLVPRSTFTDSLGQTHTRLTRYFKGIRIFGDEQIVHGPALEAAAEAPASTADLELRPALSLDQAQGVVRAQLGDSARSAGAELVLLPRQATWPAATSADLDATEVFHYQAGYDLAWRLPATAANGAAWDYFVDAGSGAILQRVSASPGDQDVRGTGNTLYSGQVALNTTVTAAGYQLLDRIRGQRGQFGGNAVVDMQNLGVGPGLLYSLPLTGPNLWGNGKPESGAVDTRSATGLTVAADAAYGMQSAWDYFGNVHGRNGLDGFGTAIVAAVHFFDDRTRQANQARWQVASRRIEILRAKDFWPRASVWVLGHELTHGITDATAGLIYSGEAGGLNEATSDIFGTLVDTYTRNGIGSTIGDQDTRWDIYRLGSDARGSFARLMRSMRKPSLDGLSPDEWTQLIGTLDPHEASGPMNRAFYFLSAGATATGPTSSRFLPQGMAGIGNDHAARIWYRALTTYLKPDSTYLDARKAALKAARDLYGADSRENIAVRRAFGAIHVGNPLASRDEFTAPTVTATVTVAGAGLLLEAATSDDARVRQVLFLVDGLPIGAVDRPPYRATVAAARILANGPHQLQAVVLDSAGNSASSAPVPFTLANELQQILADPSLEASFGAWGLTSRELRTPAPQLFQQGLRPHSGQGAAWFIEARNRMQLAQRVAIPAQAGFAQLSLWLWSRADPQAGGPSWLRVRAADPARPGQEPAVIATLSDQDARPDWVKWTFDLSPYSGRTLDLILDAQIATDSQAAFVVDDIRLQVAASAPVQITVNPAQIRLFPGATASFSARVTGASDPSVTWSLREPGAGTLNGSSYTAPNRPGFYHVLALAQADPGAVAESSIQVLPRIGISPETDQLVAGGDRSLLLSLAPGAEVDVVVRGGAGNGSLQWASGSPLAIYTAPAVPGVYRVDVIDRRIQRIAATATLTVLEPITVEVLPRELTIATGGSLEVFAFQIGGLDLGFTWFVQEGPAGGQIDTGFGGEGQVRYTAPATPGTYHLVAASGQVPWIRAMATVTVVDRVAVDPARVTLRPTQDCDFRATAPGIRNAMGANAPVLWAATGGTITEAGLYTPPDQPGVYRVVAASADGSAYSGSAEVTVVGVDLDGDGLADFRDLALLADAWGADDARADLNGDGQVDDADLEILLAWLAKVAPD